MANQQGNDILYEMVDIELLKTKNLQDEKKIIDIIGDVHEDYSVLKEKYGLSRDVAKHFKHKLYNQYESYWTPGDFVPVGNGFYCVNPKGEIIRTRTRKLVQPRPDGKGYLHIDSGEHCPRKVHRMVAETFLYNPNKLPQVNHKDGNKQNNNLSNLEWCTPKENMKHAYSNGLISREKQSERTKGSGNSQAKLTDKQVKEIREASPIISNAELARMYNISNSTISDIKSGRTWTNLL